MTCAGFHGDTKLYTVVEQEVMRLDGKLQRLQRHCRELGARRKMSIKLKMGLTMSVMGTRSL